MHTLDPVFIEHIMLATTAVNGCRYCAWGHALATTELGEDIDVVLDILHLKTDSVPAYERKALDYAIYYAENHGQVDSKVNAQLIAEYGITAELIRTVIMMINFGNLSGNTIDAFEYRIRGKKPENGSVLLEFIIYVFGGFLFKKIMLKSSLYKQLARQGALKLVSYK